MNLNRIKDKDLLTFEQARAIWRPDAKLGVLHWLPASGREGVVGGSRRADKAEYQRVSYQGSSFAVHRLLWLLCTGEWPKFVVDHINGDRQDNRLENLRDVPHRVNQLNQRYHRAGTRRNGKPLPITFDGFEARYQAAFGHTEGVTR